LNEADVPMNFYYYIDYELHPSIPEDMGRFHAQRHRETKRPVLTPQRCLP
jgi:hypothetical protein